MKKYIIYTIISGHTYIICLINGKPSVKNNPSDDQIMTFDDYDKANTIAKKNNNNDVTYKVKEINT
jgi:hypothetical protein